MMTVARLLISSCFALAVAFYAYPQPCSDLDDDQAVFFVADDNQGHDEVSLPTAPAARLFTARILLWRLPPTTSLRPAWRSLPDQRSLSPPLG